MQTVPDKIPEYPGVATEMIKTALFPVLQSQRLLQNVSQTLPDHLVDRFKMSAGMVVNNTEDRNQKNHQNHQVHGKYFIGQSHAD